MTEPSVGKGRPTPKRSEKQRRRTGPVAPPPQTRKEAARRLRQQQAEQRRQVRTGTKTGYERYLMPRDAGPVRRLVRDLVDSRRHVGVLLLPAALLPLVGQLTGSVQVLGLATTLWLATLMAAVVDFTLTGFAVAKQVRERFPEERKVRGHVVYALVRTAQFKRFRLPPPKVSVGDRV